VPAGDGWTHDPFKATVVDGLVYGRGTCDMKAGLAAMAAAMVATARSGISLQGSLALHGVIDEEVGSAGAQQAATQRLGDLVIVGEPTGGRVFTTGNGQANYEIAFRGEAVHSSHPEHGRNAICDAAAFIRLVEEETGRLALAPLIGIGPATYSVGLIEGGRGGSTVADACQLTLDRRLLPFETLEEAETQLRALLDLLGAERPGLSYELSRTVAFPPLRGRGTDEMRAVFNGAITALGGTASDPVQGMRFATDAAWYEAAGCPGVVFGPGDVTVAHQPDEHVEVSEVYAAARTLAVTCGRLLA
jgi:acetylornithine deacetylase